MYRSLKAIQAALRDLLIRILPISAKRKKTYAYAFLVHARNHEDVARKYPIFKGLPRFVIESFTRHLWPITLSEIKGLKSKKGNKPIKGWVITIPLTARQMLENRKLALKRIVQASQLAEKMGAKVIGLGALTSSLSRGGVDLIDKVSIGVTTGHAYTAYNVTSNLNVINNFLQNEKEKVVIAIVGASGSIGSTSAKILASQGYKNIILIDVPRKAHYFEKIEKELISLCPGLKITFDHGLNLLKQADYIITATNTPEALVHADDLKIGAVIFNDAQPTDVHPDVFEREDVLVIEAGVVWTPGINSHFNFGLKDRHDNFCCMAELLILAHQEWRKHYIIDRAELSSVDEIVSFSKGLNFKIAKFQNSKEIIPDWKLEKIKELNVRSKTLLHV